MGSNSLGCKANFTQTINFKGSESEYSAEIVAQDVTVNCSAGDHAHGSSKVKLKNIVNYNWELKYYIGQLIAAHVDGKVFAYTLMSKGKGLFRVINIETDQRALVREVKGSIQDISFALTPQVILGCIDDEGNLYVYNVMDDKDSSLTCTLLLHVRHKKEEPNNNYRVIWCPYIPTFGEDADTLDDPAKLLVLLNGTKAEVWDVSIVNSKYGAGPLDPFDDDYEGYVEILGHTMNVIDASFSPDGTALATASLDGYVKFFQVYMVESEESRCLHHWQPHDGKALSCLLFLDNVKTYGVSETKFWKFAITGASHNSELKIWSCESWTCLQTIRFEPNPHSTIPELFFKVSIDMSADYLLMSDINNRILYVLQIKKNEEDRVASVSTVSEFLLPSPILSFSILNVAPTNIRFSSNEDLYEENDDYDDETNLTAVAMTMIVIQPKSLQECTVTFKPEGSIASNLKTVYGNVNDTEQEEMPKLNDLQSSVSLLIQQTVNQPLNLMTPDDFNSPILNSSPSNRNSIELTSPSVKKDTAVGNLIDFQQPQKDNCASGGSSPSREVQEILSLNNQTYSSQEYFDDLNKLDAEEGDILPTNDYSAPEAEEIVKTDNVWPNIPMMKAIDVEIKEETIRKMNEEDNKDKFETLNYRLLRLESVIKQQNEEILKLQQELKSQNNKKTTDYDMRNIFVKELDVALNKYQSQTNKLFESYVKDQKRKERDLYESFLATVSQNLNKQIGEKLQTIVSQETQELLPHIVSVFEKLQIQLDVHYSQKLNTIDQLLKSNIGKLFNNKIIADTLSNSIISVIKPSLENCYKDMISTALVPSWERVCNNMFQQINNTFTQGTKEYTSSVENYMERQRKVQDKGKDLINQIQAVSDTMRANADKLSSSISEDMQRQISTNFINMQEKLSQLIVDVVKEQVKIGFRTHAAVLEDSVVNAVRSRAVTPSPLVFDTRAQLSHLSALIKKGNIDAAFQQALSASASASDLSLVLYVCEKVNPHDVFGGPKCILQQHVLLSLIQQLGADLSHSTDVKQRYLQEALLNLDTDNPVTGEHVPVILNELMRQLKLFISTNPDHKSITSMRMLLMAAKSLIK